MAKVNIGGTVKPMLIMGGGYDPCEDEDSSGGTTCTAADNGNGIYLLDADTGVFKTVFPTDRPVVGDVVVINDDETGLPKWVYASDLGGNVYRISQASGDGINNVPIGDSDPTRWDITKIASLGCDDDTCSTGEVNRKFMFGPDVVDEDGTYHILLGSGDREKPLDDWTVTYNVKNYFFMIKDRPTDIENLTVEDGSPLCETASGRGIMCLDSLAYIDVDDDPTDPDLLDEIASKRGWYLELEPHEQVVTSAITVFGITTFSSHIPTAPDPDSCEPDLGTAKVYNIDYLNSAGYGPDGVTDRSVEIKGGGLPPSPVAGRVLLDGETNPVAFIIGAEGTSPLEAKLPPSPIPNKQPKGWTYWFIGK
jgi:type IV pilus assembly protein PilY1